MLNRRNFMKMVGVVAVAPLITIRPSKAVEDADDIEQWSEVRNTIGTIGDNVNYYHLCFVKKAGETKIYLDGSLYATSYKPFIRCTIDEEKASVIYLIDGEQCVIWARGAGKIAID